MRPGAEYQEHHFQNVEDVGVAWNDNRVWVCFNGTSVFRAKVMAGKLFVEFHPPEEKQSCLPVTPRS